MPDPAYSMVFRFSDPIAFDALLMTVLASCANAGEERMTSIVATAKRFRIIWPPMGGEHYREIRDGEQFCILRRVKTAAISPESRSGLDPWKQAELPEPPMPKGFGWLGVVGPGIIVLGASIGSGEFLLGPAAFVRHGLSILWITLVAIILQTIFNLECMRY